VSSLEVTPFNLTEKLYGSSN